MTRKFRKFAATPRTSNGLLVGVEDTGNIIIDAPDGARHTVTNVDDLIDALHEAKINAVILEDLRR
jgi:hypothetical protein